MTEVYIHGFSSQEQRRLIEQAGVLAPVVFDGLDLGEAGELLEIGCGVGAELAQVARRRPRLRLTGLDRSPRHLASARDHLGHHARLVQGDANGLPFADGSFDRVLTIWVLEHVRDPAAVLAEALRVLRPDGLLLCTEVDNATFRFDPPEPVITDWWARFNRLQVLGGDPYVGGRLAGLATALRCRDVTTVAVPVIASGRRPARRTLELDYLRDLLLSGGDSMIRAGLADAADRLALIAAFDRVRAEPTIGFSYSAVRMSCRPAGR